MPETFYNVDNITFLAEAFLAVFVVSFALLYVVLKLITYDATLVIVEKPTTITFPIDSPDYLNFRDAPDPTDALFDCSPQGLVDRFSRRTLIAIRLGREGEAAGAARLTASAVWKLKPEMDPHSKTQRMPERRIVSVIPWNQQVH